MNDATLQGFRMIADVMAGPEPQDWQWIGQHMSQRMFGITEKRAKENAARYGGDARRMGCGPDDHDWMQPGDVCTDCGGVMVRHSSGVGYHVVGVV